MTYLKRGLSALTCLVVLPVLAFPPAAAAAATKRTAAQPAAPVKATTDIIALPLLRSVAKEHGPVAVVHFDAHLDTWDTYFDAPVTHGTPFRRASEEGLIDLTASLHVGIRGPLLRSRVHELSKYEPNRQRFRSASSSERNCESSSSVV